MRHILYTLSLGLVLVCYGCKSDKAQAKYSMNGKWTIYNATRDGKVTKTLESAFIVFQGDTLMNTNMFGTDKSFKFERGANSLRTTVGDPSLKLSIHQPSNDSLILSGKIRSFNMEFFLLRDSI